MKPSLVLLFFCFLNASVQAQGLKDKATHFGSGIVIGGIGGYSAHFVLSKKSQWRWISATGSSLIAALAKESWDKSRGLQPEANDVIYTVLGGIVSSLTLELIYKSKLKRKNNCGCLYAGLITSKNSKTPIFVNKGTSQNIISAIQAQNLINEIHLTF